MNEAVQLEEIERKAESKTPRLRGLAEEDMASIFDELVLLNSGAHEFKSSDITVEIDTDVIIGEGRNVRMPLLMGHPFFIDSNPKSTVNKSVRIALAYGACLAKTAINVGEGLLPQERKISQKFQGDYLVQWSPARIGISPRMLKEAKAVVVDVRGSYHAGIYGSKDIYEKIEGKNGLVSPENLGPRYHLDLENKRDLKNHVLMLREAVGYKIPILIKISSGSVYKDTKLALESSADAVIIDTSLEPFSTLSTTMGTYGASLIGVIPPALKAFKMGKARKRGVKLVVSGGFRNGSDVVKALAMGVDAVGIIEGATIALGCSLCGECYTGECEKGIATKNQDLKDIFQWKSAGKGLANYIRAVKGEVEFCANQIGVSRVRDIKEKHVAALSYDAAAITGLKLAGYDKELPMWFH